MNNVNQDLEELFLRKKPARLLVHIKKEGKPYASTLAKRIDCTYAHTVKLLQKMQELGLVTFNKDGRVKFIELTTAGNDLADEFEILLFRRMANNRQNQSPEAEEPESEEEKKKK